MYIFAYALVILTIVSGMIYGIRLALRSFRSRRVRCIYCPLYCENDTEFELRRLLHLYPSAELYAPHSRAAALLPRVKCD